MNLERQQQIQQQIQKQKQKQRQKQRQQEILELVGKDYNLNTIFF